MSRTPEERRAFVAHLRELAATAANDPAAVASLEQARACGGNLASYSIRNAFLILAQLPNASNVAGFHDWRKAGRMVRPGEHGAAILVPTGRARDKDGEPTGRMLFTWRYVFDVAQTEPLEVHAGELVGASA